MSKRRYDITAIIYDKRGNVLSIGKNSYVKTHPLHAKYAAEVGEPKSIFLHAETDAVAKCRRLDKAHKIVIFRYWTDGTPATAKPCKICLQAIRKTPIQYIEHT